MILYYFPIAQTTVKNERQREFTEVVYALDWLQSLKQVIQYSCSQSYSDGPVLKQSH